MNSVETSAVSLLQNSLVEDLLVLGDQQNNSDPMDLYMSGYESYRHWAFSSLDIVSGSFVALSFPLFCYWYYYDFNKNASKLMYYECFDKFQLCRTSQKRIC